ACERANTMGAAGSAPACQDESEPVCGDGAVDPGEDCDDGNAAKYDGCEPECPPPPESVVCAVLAPIATGTCEVVAGDDQKLISGEILAPHTVLHGGQVLID